MEHGGRRLIEDANIKPRGWRTRLFLLVDLVYSFIPTRGAIMALFVVCTGVWVRLLQDNCWRVFHCHFWQVASPPALALVVALLALVRH